MSYDIRIVDKKTGETVNLRNKHDLRGGTYCVGGTEECRFNITFNYAKWFYQIWPEPKGKKNKDITTPFGQMFAGNDGGIRSLYGKPLDEVIKELDRGSGHLHGEPTENYWEATEGNAALALFKLGELCRMARFDYPDREMTIMGD